MAEKKPADAGQQEVTSAFEEAQKKGFFGQEVDPTPNEEHSLQSGPDAPSVQSQQAIGLQARVDAASKNKTAKEA